MYRQGDVLMEKVEEIPVRERTEERLLVRGEGRNHGHYLLGKDVEIRKAGELEVAPGGGLITHYITVQAAATLEHRLIDSSRWTREHDPITIPPGKYRVIRQREYNPYARAIRAVRD